MGEMVSLVGAVGLLKASLGMLLVLSIVLIIRPRRWPRAMRWLYNGLFSLAWLVCLVVASIEWLEIQSMTKARVMNYQDLFAKQITQQLSNDFATLFSHVRQFREVYYASGMSHMDEEHFQTLASRLLDSDGQIAWVAWVPQIPMEQLNTVQHEIQKRIGNFKFIIMPTSIPLYLKPQQHIVSFPPVFSLSRMNGINQGLGYDQAGDENLRAYVLNLSAQSQKRDQIFSKAWLSSDIDGPIEGLTFYLPVFKPDQMSELQGFLAITVSLERFISDSMRDAGYADLPLEIRYRSLVGDSRSKSFYSNNPIDCDSVSADCPVQNHHGLIELESLSLFIDIWLPKSVEELQASYSAAQIAH